VNSAAPQAFLFDLDGTLVDSERENIESVALAVRRHGAQLSAEERQFIIGHSWNEIYEMIARNHALPVGMTQLIAESVEERRALMAVTGYRALPGAVWVSARTGAGIDGLRELIAARLPHPDVDVDVLVPYVRGDLVARMHRDGEVLSETHEEAGTRVTARVDGALAAALEEFVAPVA